MKDHKTYTTAAKLISDLLDDPSIEREVGEKLTRRKRINALVSGRVRANLTIREVAKRMGVTVELVKSMESWEDSDLISCPKLHKAYVNAIRTKKKGGAK